MPKSRQVEKSSNLSQAWPVIGVIATAVFSCIAGVISAFFAGASPAITTYLQRTPIIVTSVVTGSANQGFALIPVTADSTKDWQSSGISVRKGDTVLVQVVGGKWTTGRVEASSDVKQNLPDNLRGLQIYVNWQYEQSGEGLPKNCTEYHVNNCPVPNAPWGALVARIESGVPFLLGKTNTFVAPNNGVIYLGINDDPNFLGDNFGVLAIAINIR